MIITNRFCRGRENIFSTRKVRSGWLQRLNKPLLMMLHSAAFRLKIDSNLVGDSPPFLHRKMDVETFCQSPYPPFPYLSYASQFVPPFPHSLFFALCSYQTEPLRAVKAPKRETAMAHRPLLYRRTPAFCPGEEPSKKK